MISLFTVEPKQAETKLAEVQAELASIENALLQLCDEVGLDRQRVLPGLAGLLEVEMEPS